MCAAPTICHSGCGIPRSNQVEVLVVAAGHNSTGRPEAEWNTTHMPAHVYMFTQLCTGPKQQGSSCRKASKGWLAFLEDISALLHRRHPRPAVHTGASYR